MPDRLYWRSDPAQLSVLLEELADRRKREAEAAILRAGIIAAAIYNTAPGRKQGDRIWTPEDFLASKEDTDETVYVEPEILFDMLKEWTGNA